MTGGGATGGSVEPNDELNDKDSILYPVPLGAPLPPEVESPHAWIDPSSVRAANAEPVE
jgi:hypothetical protein